MVIVDTAGRLGVETEMMQQAVDIRDAVHPDEVLFVVDAMIGQDAVNTANAFAEGVGFDGVVLTKLDGDARGGAALSIARVTGSGPKGRWARCSWKRSRRAAHRRRSPRRTGVRDN